MKKTESERKGSDGAEKDLLTVTAGQTIVHS